jgi:hypothetical protein
MFPKHYPASKNQGNQAGLAGNNVEHVQLAIFFVNYAAAAYGQSSITSLDNSAFPFVMRDVLGTPVTSYE